MFLSTIASKNCSNQVSLAKKPTDSMRNPRSATLTSAGVRVHVMLPGGSSMFRWIFEHVTKELTALASSWMKIKVGAPPERMLSCGLEDPSCLHPGRLAEFVFFFRSVVMAKEVERFWLHPRWNFATLMAICYLNKCELEPKYEKYKVWRTRTTPIQLRLTSQKPLKQVC